MLKKLLTQIRRPQFVADWLDLRDANREDRQLHARYEAEVKESNATDEDDRAAIWSSYRDEYDIIWDPIYVLQTDKLVARAHKYRVRVPPQPTNSSGDDNWEWSIAARGWILTDRAKESLNRKITVEKRQYDDEFRKWATLFVSIGAFILAFFSLMISCKNKKPDPCPQNYYRNDQGECVFALKKSTPPQQSTTPSPSVPKKPSPSNPKP